MQEFIQMATSQLGIGQSTAESATGTIMEMVKDKLGESEYGQMASQLPGLDQIRRGAASSEAAGGLEGLGALGGLGGLGGGLVGKAVGALAGETGSAGGMLATLASTGLSLEQARDFAPMLFNFIKGKVDANVFNTLLQRIPELQKLVA